MVSTLEELFSQPKVTISELAGSIVPKPVPKIQPISKKPKLKDLTPEEMKAREDYTVFIGNLPLQTKRQELIKFFRNCGSIDSVRFRSIPTIESKLPKKASVILKKFSNVNESIHAYVVFKDKESVNKAIELNGQMFKERHIRVSKADDTNHDYKQTIFVGNIPFTVTEEELWKEFAKLGEVKNVRVVRDNTTQKSKGIAYIMFSNKEERKKAEAAKIVIGGRELRIKKATSKYKLEKKEKIRQGKIKEIKGKRKTAEPPIEKPKTSKDTTNPSTKDIRQQRKVQKQLEKKMKRAERSSNQSFKKPKVNPS